jgi:hypothetical protein
MPDLLDHPGGLYDAPFTLTLATSPLPRSEVRYTIDGRDPSGPWGLVYDGPIAIDTTTVLRATVVVDGAAVVATRTATFLFPADVPAQVAPAGWPSEWWTEEEGSPYAADYEMDPDVTGGATWAAAAPTMFTDLPVLSLVLDPDDLFDERRGIHENPDLHGDEWERPVSVELIDAGGVGFTVDCALRIQGGSGRKPKNTPKKSFRLRFKGEYGPKTLEYPLYPDSSVTSFDTIVLRGGYNRSWAHFFAPGRERADYARERFGHEIYRNMGHLAPHVRSAHLFLNGLYWGIYQLEERPTAEWQAAYAGGLPEEWDTLNAGTVMDGDDVAWQALMATFETDLSDPANYAAVEEQLDVDAFIDYLILNFSLDNADWPDRNWWAARQRVDGARWSFVTWDNEFLIGTTSTPLELTRSDENTPGEMFQALRVNPEFQVRFGDRLQRNHFGAGALTSEGMTETFTSIADEIVPGVIGESARWGDHWRDVRGAADAELYTYDDQWLAEYDRLVGAYFPGRTAIVIPEYQAAGLYPTILAPTVSPAGGEVPADTSVTLEAAAGQIYYTLDGTDPREAGGAIAAGAQVYAGALAIASSTTLSARVWTDEGWSALVELAFLVD